MAISVAYKDTLSVFEQSSTTLSVPIDASVASGDLIIIGYFCRDTLTVPTGFTQYADQINGDGFGGRQGMLTKTADGTETSVTLTQATAQRFEAIHMILRGSVDTLTPSQTSLVDADSATTATLPTITESSAFAAVSVASTAFTGANVTPFDIGASSDVEYVRWNNDSHNTVNGNRIWGSIGLYTGADTTTMQWENTYGTRDWGAGLLTILEGSSGAVDVGTATETDTANAITPQQDVVVSVGTATETDTANAITEGQVTTLVTSFDAGNVDPDLSSITDAATSTPTVFVDARPAAINSGWRFLLFAVEGVDGKSPTFRLNRNTMTDHNFPILSTWLPLYTQDFRTWTQATSRTLSGSYGNPDYYIEFTFDSPLPAGRVYVSTHPMEQNAYAATFAADILSSYASVASPTASADASGVYNTSPAETDEDGRAIGTNDQFALKLEWGGSTTDGGPKRKLLMNAGTHAAGEHFSWLAFEKAVRWLLDDTSTAAQNLRANWDVYLYFNITPNGLTGGQSRWNFRVSTDPNRDFVDQTLQEIAAFTSAASTDTGGAIDAFFSWHTWGRYDDLYIVATRSGLNTQTSAFVTNLESAVGTVTKEYYSLTGTGSNWAYDTLGATIAFEAEMGMRAPTAVSGVEQIGVTWMQTLEVTDSQGYFSPIGTATETNTANAITASAGSQTAVSVGTASETDTANTIAPQQDVVASVGTASETDTANAITPAQDVEVAVGAASESGTANAITASVAGSSVDVGAGEETDNANAITAGSNGIIRPGQPAKQRARARVRGSAPGKSSVKIRGIL